MDYTQCRRRSAAGRWVAETTRADGDSDGSLRQQGAAPRGLAPLQGNGTGPGTVSCEMLELGNGSCEIRYTGTVAGGILSPLLTEPMAAETEGAEACTRGNGDAKQRSSRRLRKRRRGRVDGSDAAP